MAKKRTTKRRGSSMTIAQLERALANTKQKIQGLKERRKKLLAQVADVDKQIAELAGEPVAPVADEEAPAPTPAKRKRRRKLPKNTMTLADAVAKVLGEAKEPMRAGGIAEAVTALGYKSKGQRLSKQVAIAATQDERVEKVARGLFALKKKAKK